ncbi:unnamed protein product, partial [Mesorhabditis spiculigera]
MLDPPNQPVYHHLGISTGVLRKIGFVLLIVALVAVAARKSWIEPQNGHISRPNRYRKDTNDACPSNRPFVCYVFDELERPYPELSGPKDTQQFCLSTPPAPVVTTGPLPTQAQADGLPPLIWLYIAIGTTIFVLLAASGGAYALKKRREKKKLLSEKGSASEEGPLRAGDPVSSTESAEAPKPPEAPKSPEATKPPEAPKLPVPPLKLVMFTEATDEFPITKSMGDGEAVIFENPQEALDKLLTPPLRHFKKVKEGQVLPLELSNVSYFRAKKIEVKFNDEQPNVVKRLEPMPNVLKPPYAPLSQEEDAMKHNENEAMRQARAKATKALSKQVKWENEEWVIVPRQHVHAGSLPNEDDRLSSGAGTPSPAADEELTRAEKKEKKKQDDPGINTNDEDAELLGKKAPRVTKEQYEEGLVEAKKMLPKVFSKARMLAGKRVGISLESLDKINAAVLFMLQQDSRQVVLVDGPAILFGDLHGNDIDLSLYLTTLTDHVGHADPKMCTDGIRLIFMGDYVDRGEFSLEVLLKIHILKILYPDRVHLLRGNHETARINTRYGFYEELTRRFEFKAAKEMWRTFNWIFSWYPLIAHSPGRFIAMHGGGGETVAEDGVAGVNAVGKPICDPDTNTTASEVMWSDFNAATGGECGFVENVHRGNGVYFNQLGLSLILENCNVGLMVRAHQLKPSGFGMAGKGKCATVFSSSNYQLPTRNHGAILCIGEDSFTVFQLIVKDCNGDFPFREVHDARVVDAPPSGKRCSPFPASEAKPPNSHTMGKPTVDPTNIAELGQFFETVIRDEELARKHDQQLLELTNRMANEGRIAELKDAFIASRNHLDSLPNARASKIVRTLVDACLRVKGSSNVEKEALCLEAIGWAKSTARLYLSRALRARLVRLYNDIGKYGEVLKITAELMREIRKVEDRELLIEIALEESRAAFALNNFSKAKTALATARTVSNGFYTSVALQAQLDLQSGVLYAADERDFKTAYSYFFEAFEGFSQLDDRRRATQGLKYMCLCKVMLDDSETMKAFLESKACQPYLKEKDIEAMKELSVAFRKRSLAIFQECFAKYPIELKQDLVVHGHSTFLYESVLEKEICRVVEPYSSVEVKHVAERIGLPYERIEKKLDKMILDLKLRGVVNQQQGILMILEPPPSEKTYQKANDLLKALNKVVDACQQQTAALF